MKKKSLEQNKYIYLCIYLLYLIFNIVLLCRHEMWRDEINVWLMGRDLSVVQLFQEIKYQGHPCLWYLLIMPFAKLGISCRIMGIISLLIMSVAAYLYLFKAPMNIVVKAVTLFSPIFTYYYAEIARGYCLVALLTILLAYFYRIRNEKPLFYGLLLGLQVQADTIALPIAGMISAMWLMENMWTSIKAKEKRYLLTAVKGLWIPLLSLFLWIAQFYRVSDSPVYEVRDYGLTEFVTSVINYCYWIMERLTGINRNGCTILFVVLVIIGIALSIIWKSAWPFIVLGTTILFQSIFSCVVYELNIFHFISLCFVYIWMVWVYAWKKEEKENSLSEIGAKIEKGVNFSAALWIGVVAIFMFVRWNSPEETHSLDNALNGSYSDGANTAKYIEDNLSEDEVLVTTDVALASTIWGFAEEHRAYYAGSGKETSYADWSEEQTRSISWEELMKWVQTNFPEKDSFILINCTTSCIQGMDLSRGEVLYITEKSSARQEDYTIYRISCK